MRRLLRVPMLIVLLALALIPAATLPFAERIRTEWTQFWEPEVEAEVVDEWNEDIPILLSLPDLISIESSEYRECDGSLTVPVDPQPDLPDA